MKTNLLRKMFDYSVKEIFSREGTTMTVRAESDPYTYRVCTSRIYLYNKLSGDELSFEVGLDVRHEGFTSFVIGNIEGRINERKIPKVGTFAPKSLKDYNIYSCDLNYRTVVDEVTIKVTLTEAMDGTAVEKARKELELQEECSMEKAILTFMGEDK